MLTVVRAINRGQGIAYKWNMNAHEMAWREMTTVVEAPSNNNNKQTLFLITGRKHSLNVTWFTDIVSLLPMTTLYPLPQTITLVERPTESHLLALYCHPWDLNNRHFYNETHI